MLGAAPRPVLSVCFRSIDCQLRLQRAYRDYFSTCKESMVRGIEESLVRMFLPQAFWGPHCAVLERLFLSSGREARWLSRISGFE